MSASVRRNAAQLATVIGVHLAIIAGLLVHKPSRDAIVQIIPVVASIVPTRVEPPPAPPPKPQPQVQQVQPAPAVPVIAAEATPNTPPPVSAPAPVPPPAPAPAAPSPVKPAAPPTVSVAPPSPSGTTSPPRSINPRVEYPSASRNIGETGTVTLALQISATGTLDGARVASSSGSARLDAAALRAARNWKFVPARRAGEPVAGSLSIRVNFTLEDESSVDEQP